METQEKKADGIGPGTAVIIFIGLFIWGSIESKYVPLKGFRSLFDNTWMLIEEVFLPALLISIIAGVFISLAAHLIYREL